MSKNNQNKGTTQSFPAHTFPSNKTLFLVLNIGTRNIINLVKAYRATVRHAIFFRYEVIPHFHSENGNSKVDILTNTCQCECPGRGGSETS
jgi:hypothetical protein